MYKRKLLKIALVVLSVVFIGLQLPDEEIYAIDVRAVLLMLLCALYYIGVKHKRKFFCFFMLTYTLADVLGAILDKFVYKELIKDDYVYFLCNGLYILAYVFLIVQILSTLNFKIVLNKFPIQFVILLILDVFCTVLITNTVRDEYVLVYDYFIEFVYNGVLMLLLTLALLNYFYRDDKKAMNLLLASIFIVFSEIIQMAFIYITENKFLKLLYAIFLILAFTFFYVQAQLKHNNPRVALYK